MIVLVTAKVKQQVSELVVFNEPNTELFTVNGPRFTAKVKALPTGGQANQEITELLAKYYKVPKNQVKLIRGAKSGQKTFDITTK